MAEMKLAEEKEEMESKDLSNQIRSAQENRRTTLMKIGK